MKVLLVAVFMMTVVTTVLLAQSIADTGQTWTIKRSVVDLSPFELEQDPYEGCTIGVAAGLATTDGRPLLWKTRDSEAYNNEVVYITSRPYKFVAVISAGLTAYAWMGVNEKGFAIINSASADLPGGTSGYGNGTLMHYALGTCASASDFEELLDQTNLTGRQTQANFGVIDADGAAAIYETAASQYWKYDANDHIHAPKGYVLRTNFALNGGGSAGMERYLRTQTLIGSFYSGNILNHISILRTQMRDFSDYNSNPLSVPFLGQWADGVPYGYIDTRVSICRAASVSAAVIHGVKPGESPLLSTMWTILGQPATAIAVPYWPVGATPSASDGYPTAPLCDIANEIWYQLFDWPADLWYMNTYKLRDEKGNGLWCQTFSAEDSIFRSTDSLLEIWRADTGFVSQMMTAETVYTNYALNKTTDCYNQLVAAIEPELATQNPVEFELMQNFPNPFNPVTAISYRLSAVSHVNVSIYNVLGQKVATLVNEKQNVGYHNVQWDASGFASGVYYYQIRAGEFQQVKKMILIK